MGTWIIFQVGEAGNSGINPKNAFGGLTNILTEHWDYSGKEGPKVGYRPEISKTTEEETNGWPDSFRAPGDWVVSSVVSYSADAEAEAEFDRIIVCTCNYDPISEEDRPWKYVPVAPVTALSFGEGPEAEEAFRKWKEENPEKCKGTKHIARID